MPRYIERFRLGIEKGEREKIDYSQEGLVNLEIKEPVVVKGEEAFTKARKIKAKKIKAEGSVFAGAEDCQIERVKATRKSAFTSARHCQVEVVNTATHAFWMAENCQAKEVKTGSGAFSNAKDCWAGRVKSGTDAFREAERCRAERVEARAGAFGWSEECLITEKVKAGKIGQSSLGVVVLGKTEGKVSPSVTLMKGKLEGERPEEIRKFFEDQLKKSQKGEESIYDYLSFFNWEGKTLKEGKEKLKRRYERVKEKRYLLEELRDYSFFFLIGDNSKREEILFDFGRLEEDKKVLLSLNYYLPQLEKVKDYLSVLSLDDWVKLGEYAEFLDFDEEKLKEIKDKDPGLIREALLDSPKENLRSYLRGLGIELEDKEINRDTIIAATVHKLLRKEKEKLLVKRNREKPREFDIKIKR